MKSIEIKAVKDRRNPSPCPICGMVISNSYGMSCHLRRHNNDKPYKCEKCPKAFIIRSELKKHEIAHTEERPYKCDECNKYFKKQQSLKVHLMKYCTGIEVKYFCSLCNEAFPQKKQLNLHEESVHGRINRNLVCRLCEEVFKSEDEKDQHEESIHGVVHENKQLKRRRGRPKNALNLNMSLPKIKKCTSLATNRDPKRFSCKICSERFFFQSEQIKHYKEQHKEQFDKFFKSCEICGKVLNQQYYEGHKRSHKGLDFFPFVCPFCEYKTIRQQDLKFHLRVHSKEFPYECKICSMLYRSKKQMTTCVSKHTGVKNVKCDKCERVFFSVADLTSHRSQLHTVHECKYCNYKTEKKRHLQKHCFTEHNIKPKKRKKSFVCDRCNASFASQAALTIHLKKHLLSNVNWTERMKKIQRCLYCSYIGDSAEDLLDHGLRSHEANMFKCDKCPYATFHRFQFQRHENMHIRTAPTGRPRGRPRKDDLSVLLGDMVERNPEGKSIGVDWECFLCGFMSSFPEMMKKHFLTHDKFISKLPWDSSDHFDIPITSNVPISKPLEYKKNVFPVRPSSTRFLTYRTKDENIDDGSVKVEDMSFEDELLSELVVEDSDSRYGELIEGSITLLENSNSFEDDVDYNHFISGKTFLSADDIFAITDLSLNQEDVAPL